MSSVVLDFNDGSSSTGENLEYIGKQAQANLIDVKPNGNDSPSSVSIVGGSKDDIIRLTAAGDSTALGLDGNDTIIGGAGDDLIGGGEGHDELKGSLGKDTLVGGVGNDYLDGGQDNDILSGGIGHDSLRGGLGNDILDGGLGDDTLEGNDGNDMLKGGAGDDMLKGGAGRDTLRGGAGDDIFEFVASDLVSAADKIVDFQDNGNDLIKMMGVGDSAVGYDSDTGMITMDGQEAIYIGEGLDIDIVKDESATDTWDIM